MIGACIANSAVAVLTSWFLDCQPISGKMVSQVSDHGAADGRSVCGGCVKTRGPGRPALAKGEGKAAIFSVRLSPEEREQVEKAGLAMGLKASAWARLVLIDAAASSLTTTKQAIDRAL